MQSNRRGHEPTTTTRHRPGAARFIAGWIPIALSVVSVASVMATDVRRPNIVLMMADDMGMGDTSAFQNVTGNRPDVQLHTPHMERLANMGVRFTDAHTPSSRCSPTRYALLTGRYPWRNRLKHWVLFGAQGDPMIEADRPTIASLLRGVGYHTAMVGKWHVGLRYRNAHGLPAAGWEDADLRQPLHTTPLDHGFDYARFTSRSHGTSGPDAGNTRRRRNDAQQSVGPGHVHGRIAVGATSVGKRLIDRGRNAYVLSRLGSRHSDHAVSFLEQHLADAKTQQQPFFLYYPANANHGPYTPDDQVGRQQVAGAARTKSGQPMDARHDFIYENDVALGRLLDWLEAKGDPRDPGKKLISNTLVIFTSDNGAEKNSNVATGPFRSHKGSVYEGGHRVPFLVAWPAGGVGDGTADDPGATRDSPFSLQDLFATFAEIVNVPLPDLRAGKKGAEDSYSVLSAWRGESSLADRPPMIFNDHKEADEDRAAAAIRVDSPTIAGQPFPGQWKLFFDAKLLRRGRAHAVELFNLREDPRETIDRLADTALQPLVEFMTKQALLHRNAGGHRYVPFTPAKRTVFRFRDGDDARQQLLASPATDAKAGARVAADPTDPVMTIIALRGGPPRSQPGIFTFGRNGLGVMHGDSDRVDAQEAVVIRFDCDVVVESAEMIAGRGSCGGFYQVGNAAPLAIYCTDADNDAQDQSGLLSDIGVLLAGEPLRLDSTPHFGVEKPGSWRLASLVVRKLQPRPE